MAGPLAQLRRLYSNAGWRAEAGRASPPGKKMGHAGAIVMGDKGSYAGKKAALEAAGVTVCATPNDVALALKARLG